MAKKKPEKPRRVPTRRQISHYEHQKKRQRIIRNAGLFVIASVILILGAGWFFGDYQPRQETAIKVNGTEFSMQHYVDVLKLQSQGQSPEYVQAVADITVTNIEQNEILRQGALDLGVTVSDEEIKEELEERELPDSAASKDFVRGQLLMTKLLDTHFDEQVPVNAEQVHIMAMLLESEAQAEEVRAGLGNSGNFTEMAREYSADYLSRLNGRDYGWHTRSISSEFLPEPVVDYAFDAPVNTLSHPLYDEEGEKNLGYWLAKVLDRNEEEEEAHVLLMLLGSEEEALTAVDRLKGGEDFAAVAADLSQLKGAEENKGEYLLAPGMKTAALDEFIFDPAVPVQTLSDPIRDEETTTRGGYWLVKAAGREEDRPIAEADRDVLKAKAFEEWFASLWEDPGNEIDHGYLDEGNHKAWAVEQAVKGL